MQSGEFGLQVRLPQSTSRESAASSRHSAQKHNTGIRAVRPKSRTDPVRRPVRGASRPSWRSAVRVARRRSHPPKLRTTFRGADTVRTNDVSSGNERRHRASDLPGVKIKA